MWRPESLCKNKFLSKILNNMVAARHIFYLSVMIAIINEPLDICVIYYEDLQ
jgi:hypothetical protein